MAPPQERPPQNPPQPLPRRVAEYLPSPMVVLVLSLFALYVVFSSTTPHGAPIILQPEPAVDPRADSEHPHHKITTSTFVQTSIVTRTVTATASVHHTKSPRSKPKSKSSSTSATMSSTEQTFIAIKPDGVQRGLVGPIISRFESRGYKLVAIKLVTPGKEHLEAHYADLKEKPFFPGLITYMLSGPICAMVWEGRDAVKTGRTLLGATNPLASAPGTIRGDFAIDVGRNVCHGSDSVENAQKEIALWFKEGEVVSWESAAFNWVYEKA